MRNKPELLAPAGGMASLIAAVQSGANAVYLGAGDFNARRSATTSPRTSCARRSATVTPAACACT